MQEQEHMLKKTEPMLQIHYSLIHKLEVQVGQIANILSKPYAGTLLPSDLMKISKEHINDSP